MRQLRLAVRGLRRTPGFTITTVLALALGIGAATTVFSIADGLLFRPLPYRDAGRLVSIGADIRARGFTDWAPYPEAVDGWRRGVTTLNGLAAFAGVNTLTLSLPGEPVELRTSRVTPDLLSVLGVAPRLGRPFSAEDFTPGAARAVLLTDAAWRRLFDGDPAVVGRSYRINDEPADVIGVLPRGFVLPTEWTFLAADALAPFVRADDWATTPQYVIGRLADGVTLDAVRAELDGVAAAVGGRTSLRDAVIDGATVTSLNAKIGRGSRRTLLLLVGAVAALVLIGCANVANLILARGTDRSGELAVRAALGAGRASLIGLLVTESVALAVAGGMAGLFLASWAVSAIGPLVPPELTLLGPIALSGRALAFAALASAASVLVASVGPALRMTRPAVLGAIGHSASRTATGRLRVRHAIVAVEVALAVVLLVGGGLMAGTLMRLLRVDLGFGSRDVMTMRVQLPTGTTPPERSREFVTRALDAARHTPGVTRVAAMAGQLLNDALYGSVYGPEGFTREWLRQDAAISDIGGPCCLQTHRVSVDYFDVLGVRVTRGRGFQPSDATGTVPVALIGERLARRMAETVNPVGHYLVGSDPSDRRLIVGVVEDVRDMGLRWNPALTIYLPIEERGATAITLLASTSGPPASVTEPLREAVQRGTGPVILTEARTFDDLVGRSAGERRLYAWLFGSFAVLALALAAIGISGVISYSVARRTREMGLRLALGARPSQVRRLVLRESLTPVAIGIVAGIGAALALGRFVASLLFQMQPLDVPTYFGAVVVLGSAAAVAAWVPALRAGRVAPMDALRAD
ncbi:MAG: ADOP family duplicated permease [Vicinamibacterales bacterium]